MVAACSDGASCKQVGGEPGDLVGESRVGRALGNSGVPVTVAPRRPIAGTPRQLRLGWLIWRATCREKGRPVPGLCCSASRARIAAHADHRVPRRGSISGESRPRLHRYPAVGTRAMRRRRSAESRTQLGHQPKFTVNGTGLAPNWPSCTNLRDEGWHGVWCAPTDPASCGPSGFPASAVKTISQTGAPMWAVEVFDRLRAANGGNLDGFFRNFARRDPAKLDSTRRRPREIRSGKVKRKFVSWRWTSAIASKQFTIIKVPNTI